MNSKHLFLLWILVIIAVIGLGFRQISYAGLSNAANIRFSQGLIQPTDKSPQVLSAGLDLLGSIERSGFTAGSEVLRLSGLTKLSLGDTKEGEEDLIQASNLGNPFADYALASWYTSQLNWPQAAIYFDKTQPAASHVLNQAIDRLIAADRRSDAIQLASEYVDIHPNSPGTYYRLANLHWSSGNRQGTIQALSDALTYDQQVDSSNYRYQTARLLYLQTNYPAAALVIEDLLNENTSDFAVLFLAGQIFYAQEDYPKAEQLLLSALEQNPKHLHAHLALAATYLVQSKTSQAAHEYQQASILAFDPSSYLDLLADVYRQMGEECKEQEALRIVELVRQKQVDLVREFQNMNLKCSP